MTLTEELILASSILAAPDKKEDMDALVRFASSIGVKVEELTKLAEKVVYGNERTLIEFFKTKNIEVK